MSHEYLNIAYVIFCVYKEACVDNSQISLTSRPTIGPLLDSIRSWTIVHSYKWRGYKYLSSFIDNITTWKTNYVYQ